MPPADAVVAVALGRVERLGRAVARREIDAVAILDLLRRAGSSARSGGRTLQREREREVALVLGRAADATRSPSAHAAIAASSALLPIPASPTIASTRD